MTRRGTASIVASPVLVGAVTTLVIVVAVVLAYNANQGLPFVPTYDLKAELPHGANLVEGNEVRIGGFRVGQISRISPRSTQVSGVNRTIAVIDMDLDKKVQPLPTDSTLIVRPRSALGLKYVELIPGSADTVFEPGDTIPLAQAGDPVEFDDLFNTFDADVRDDSRRALMGYGDALAGRGQSINVSLEALPVFFGSLTRVMDSLNDPRTELDEFFVQIGRAAEQVAPVSEVQAQLFTNMADTFQALSADPAALQATIERAPPTLDAAISSFRVQRPFLADFTELSRRLQPAVEVLPGSLPTINSALRAGQNVLPRTVRFNRRLEDVFRGLIDLSENPNTLLALQDLDTLNDVTGPLVQHVGPYQAVCNSLVYFFTPLAEHLSEQVPGGTIQRVLIRTDPGLESEQPNRFGAYGANRPADIPANQDPDHVEDAYAYHEQPYQPAVDRRGRADCENGQEGFMNGPFNPLPLPPRTLPGVADPAPGVAYGPAIFDNSDLPSENEGRPSATALGGGSSTVTAPDIPYATNGGRAGPTFDPNSPDGLGVRRLEDVP